MKITANTFYQAIIDVINDGKGDHLAISYNNVEYSFKELLYAIDVCESELRAKGLKEGDHIGILGYNSDNWFITFMAVMKIRAVASLYSYSMDPDAIMDLMKLTEITYLAYSDNSILDKDKTAFDKLISDMKFSNEKLYDFRPTTIYFKEKIKNVRDFDKSYKDLDTDIAKKTPAFIIFTSGTTALPKACMLSQYGFLCDIKYYEEVVPDYDKKVGAICIPLYHCFALMETVKLLAWGSTAILPVNFKNDAVIDSISKYKTNLMASVGSVYTNLMEDKRFNDNVAAYIDIALIGGGLMTETQMMRLESAYRNASFVNGYGQTEASVDICLTRPTDTVEQRVKTVGRPFSAKKVFIIDSNNNKVPQGTQGEIAVLDEGNILIGYYNLPKEKQAVDENGYLHTGDIGYFDEDGYLVLSGRIKDIITKSGENISPIEIERVIIEDENVKEVKVMGAPHHLYGENIEACVVLRDKNAFDAEKTKERLKKTLSSFKIPDRFYIFDSFPLNPNGKLDARKLKTDFLTLHKEQIIKEGLISGIKIADITVIAKPYNITGIAANFEALAESMHYDEKRSKDIRLVMEEIISYCISNSYAKDSNIKAVALLNNGYIRFAIHYDGEYKDLKNVVTEDGITNIIVNKVDAITINEYKDNKYYCLDFLYPKDFDIKDFLLKNS